MADGFKVGAVVMLKSGGPSMTIEGIGDYSPMASAGHDQAKCVWFEGNKRMEGVFELAALKMDDRHDSPAVLTVPRRDRRGY